MNEIEKITEEIFELEDKIWELKKKRIKLKDKNKPKFSSQPMRTGDKGDGWCGITKK